MNRADRLRALVVSVTTIVVLSGCGSREEQSTETPGATQPTGSGEMQAHAASGIVKEVNTEAGSVIIAHEPVQSLNWPAMTMGFNVQDAQDLSSLKEGDRVTFEFTKQSPTEYAITEISPQQ